MTAALRWAFAIATLAVAAWGFSGCGEAPAASEDVAVHASTVRVVWADGATDYPGWCAGRVPTWFRCDNGADCRPRILDGIRAWLSPFDVEVTDVGVETSLVTVLMSSGLAQECGREPGLRGLAMIGAPAAGSWISIWSAGNDDRADAQTIAHELGHAIGGLRHVADGSVMEPGDAPVEVGYDDVRRSNVDGTTQNAREAMAWTLGLRGAP